jgi:hypothetical protein
MASAGWELQKSIHIALTADATLASQLGGARIYDDVPDNASFPYITFGQTSLRDWSTGSDEAHEHAITLHVWSQANGREEALRIMDTVKSVLHDQPLTLSGHRLINLRHEFSGTRRNPDGETVHGTVRMRATTEPI